MDIGRGPEIDRAAFLEHRAARRGTGNPTRMTNPVWAWIVREELGAYGPNQDFDGPDPHEAGPGFAFERFGCSETELPDGRTIHIAGEHEDHYDPDFFIYNDVIVRDANGDVEVYGYSEEAFPPTDFHSATLHADRIVIVGNLGYPEHRRHGETPVLSLDLETFAITPVATSGEAPGWIRDHEAELGGDGDTLFVRGGKVELDGTTVDNIDDWALTLSTGAWRRLTKRPWQQWTVRREDGEPLMLFEMDSATFDEDHPDLLANRVSDPWYDELDIEPDPRKQLEAAGRNYDRAVFERLWNTPESSEPFAGAEPEYPVRTCFVIDTAVVRYVEEDDAIQVKVAGELPEDVVRGLCDGIAVDLAHLQGAACTVQRVGRQD